MLHKNHTAGFLALVQEAKSRIREISIEDLKRMRAEEESFLLIDVREDAEWAAGHAKGALHLGKGIIERDIENQIPETGTKLVLYCGGGFRSALAADAIQKMGYGNAVSLDGGWRAYQASGLAIADPSGSEEN